MRICYVNPTNNIRRPIAELATILAQEGHQISIMYPQSKECPTKNWVANDTVEKQQIQRKPVVSWYFAPLRYSFQNPIKLLRETRSMFKNNDVVHIWEYYYPISVFPLLYALLTGQRKKVILTTDGFVGYSYKPKEPRWLVPVFKFYTLLFARLLFKIPRTMTTYGKAMLPFARQAGVPMNKIEVLPTGIHLNRFNSINLEKVKEIKEEFKINSEGIILFVGMLTERKGVDKVISISSQLLDEGHNIKTILVGDAHGENVFRKNIPERHREKIIFAGGRKEIPEFMKLAHVLLLPSEGEGLPGVVMEAMASGLPVVATKEGCTPDLIEDGNGGILIDDGNYCKPIQKIITDQKISEQLRQKGKEKIKHFSWERVARQYRMLYGILDSKSEKPKENGVSIK